MKDTTLIVFDIDGTLLNSVHFNVENMNRALEKMGVSYRVTEECIKKHLGCTAEVFDRNVLDENTYPMRDVIRTEMRQHAKEMMLRYGTAFEGVYETFKKLHGEGIKLVLYSNCSRPYLEAAVSLIGIEKFLDYTECVKDNGLEKPKLLHKILEKYRGHKAIVVGDRIHDVEAAHANGIPCVGATYGFGLDELDAADYAIERMNELVVLLGKV